VLVTPAKLTVVAPVAVPVIVKLPRFTAVVKPNEFAAVPVVLFVIVRVAALSTQLLIEVAALPVMLRAVIPPVVIPVFSAHCISICSSSKS